MDNFLIDVTAMGRAKFDLVMRLVFEPVNSQREGRRAVAYAVHPTLGLVFYWHLPEPSFDGKARLLYDPGGVGCARAVIARRKAAGAKIDEGDAIPGDVGVEVKALPYEMGMEAATTFAWHWLETAKMERAPDIDGGTKRGWRIYNEGHWGFVGDDSYAFIAVKPTWAKLGK